MEPKKKKKNLIALVDGSAYSASVIDHAAWASKRMNTGVEVFHMLRRRELTSVSTDLSGSLRLGARSALLSQLAESDAERAKLAQARGRMILEDAADRLKAADVDPVESRLRNDDIIETIKTFESEAKMIVIGKRGEASGYARDHLGSNLDRILRTASIRVMVASRDFQPINRYLIAYDGGQSVRKAIDQIAGAKLLGGLSCTLMHVGRDTPEIRGQMEGAAALLQDHASEVNVDIRPGEPDMVISQAVEQEGFDLLVIGAYGQSPIRKLIIGSTSSALVRLCRVPVVMYH